jgi:hypothetical protein
MSIDTLERGPAPHRRFPAPAPELLRRIQNEYHEMPGLILTEAQARRLWSLDAETCRAVLTVLLQRRFLRRTPAGAYIRSLA